MGVARQKIWGGPTETYGNEKYYYFWVHKQCAKHTPSREVWGHAPTGKFWKISAIYKIESGSNFGHDIIIHSLKSVV